MDKAKFSHQKVLGALRKCCQNAIVDSDNRLSDCRLPQKRTQKRTFYIRVNADFQRIGFRQNTSTRVDYRATSIQAKCQRAIRIII